MIDLPEAVRVSVEQRVRDELSCRVTAWSALQGGTNNRLFRLDTAEGPPLLAKLYHRDQWNRLEREFETLTVLREHGFTRVPKPYLRSDAHCYGVYSFEPGSTREPSHLSDEHMRAAALFAAELHRISPDDVGERLPPAIEVCDSLAQQLGRIDGRLRSFEQFAAGAGAYDEVRALCREVDLRRALDSFIAEAMAGLTADDLTTPLPHSALRLTSGDFGVHNLLVREDGAVTVFDWEWSGWDDPARLVMGFVAHGGSEGLSARATETFLGTYAASTRLPETEIARFERVGRLLDVEWIAAYASALTPERIAAQRFATGETDPRPMLSQALARLKARLVRARSGVSYRFPARR